MRVLLLASLGALVSGKPHQKRKVGDDINLGDLYHPWENVTEDTTQRRPSNPQHQIAEYLMDTLQAGDSLDKAVALFESYSESNKLGMSLGNEKGTIIESAIADSIVSKNLEQIVFLEFGSHIGDGTLRIIRQLAKSTSAKRCLVFSLEANQEWLVIGTSIVRRAIELSSESVCQYVPLALKKDVSRLLDMIKTEYQVRSIDGVFLDHNHAQFTTDVNIMNEKHLLREGTLIIADNALRHRKAMRGFIDMMRDHSKTFTLVDTKDPYPDQLLISEWRMKHSHSEEL